MKVQTYGGNKVSTQAVSHQRARTTKVANTSLAPGVTNLLKGVDAYQQKVDETAAEEALINFEREKNKMFFDPKDGYFNKQGRDAFEGGATMSTGLTELQNKYADQLTSPRARDAFKKASDVHVTRGMADIDKHSTTGLKTYEMATQKARIENSIESASLYWNNPEEAEVQFAVGYTTIKDMAEEQGLDAIATNEMLQSYESNFTMKRIEAAMSSDLTAANELFEKYGDRIEGQDRIVVERGLAKANFDMSAGATAEQIINTGADTLTELMGQVDNLPSDTPEETALKTEVQRLVTDRHTLNKRMKEEQLDTIYQNYAKAVQDGNGSSNRIPAAAWDAMSYRQRENIKKMEREMAKGAPRVTNERLFQDLMSLPPEKKSKLDPLDYYDSLKDSDYNALQKAVNSAKHGKTSEPDYIDATGNATRMKKAMQSIFGGDVSKLKGDKLDRYNAVSRSIQMQIEAETEANNGKKLSPSKLDALYNEFTRKQVIEKDWWPDKTNTLEDYDAADIDTATRYLQQLGAPITSTNIMNLITNNPDKFEN